MRVVIKGADFSEVSIGKVIKDLSFSYNNGTKVLGILLNPPTGVTEVTTSYSAGSAVNPATEYYMGGSSDQALSTANNANRFASDFIEVAPGMVVTGSRVINTATVPSVVAFDAQKNVLTPAKCAWSTDGAFTYTVPEGVSYIKFQMTQLLVDTSLIGTMIS